MTAGERYTPPRKVARSKWWAGLIDVARGGLCHWWRLIFVVEVNVNVQDTGTAVSRHAFNTVSHARCRDCRSRLLPLLEWKYSRAFACSPSIDNSSPMLASPICYRCKQNYPDLCAVIHSSWTCGRWSAYKHAICQTTLGLPIKCDNRFMV